MLNFEDYKNKLPVPHTIQFRTYTIVSKKGVIVADNDSVGVAKTKIDAFVTDKPKNWDTLTIKLKAKFADLFFEEKGGDESYRLARKIYDEEDVRIADKFYKDAMESVGLLQHRNANKIYDYAYERGHSSGYPEIYNVLLDLSELFKD